MFSYKYFKNFNTFSHRTPLVATSGNSGLPVFEISKRYIQDTTKHRIKHQAFGKIR